MTDAITRAAHAICRERCFMFGNYPCSPKSHCRVSSGDQPSCLVLAKAALAAIRALIQTASDPVPHDRLSPMEHDRDRGE